MGTPSFFISPLWLLSSLAAPISLLAQAPVVRLPANPEPAAIPQGSPNTKSGDTLLPPPQIEWKEIAQLPPVPGFENQPGLAGHFAGSNDLFLIIAGGANFIAGQAANDAPRAYWDKIFVLEKTRSEDGNHQFTWRPAKAELQRETAYGASVNTGAGLLCIGGRNVDKCFADCYLLRWDTAQSKVVVEDFPKLPTPLAHMTAVKIENHIYVVGGRETPTGRATKTFLSLDLSQKDNPATFTWQKLPAWDGPERIHALASAGNDGDYESLYLCGGRNPGGAYDEDFLTDLHRYDPRKKAWSLLGSALDPAGNTATLMAAPAFFVPPHHMVVVSGTDEKLTALLEDNAHRKAAADPQEAKDRNQLNQIILDNFPGYSRNVMAFDIIASDWSMIGTFPERPPVATVVVPWDGNYVIPCGETGPGKRSPKIWQASVRKKARVVE